MKRALILSGFLVTAAMGLWADEGMWPLNNFPSSQLKSKYGFGPDQQWLDHVRLSAVRLASGCSASFVSPQSLVLTNHHCAVACVQSISAPGKDYVTDGYYAKTPAEEIRCPGYEINQLTEITDVTDPVKTATK